MNPRIVRTILVAAACGVAGAGAGIAGSDAHSTKPQRAFHHGAGNLFRGGPVHAELVVPDRQGGFRTVTLDRGVVESASGDQLTIKEGTPTATYKTVTLTIPSTAKVRRNHDGAQLSDLQPGDLVTVVQSGDQTFVKAKAAGDARRRDRKHD